MEMRNKKRSATHVIGNEKRILNFSLLTSHFSFVLLFSFLIFLCACNLGGDIGVLREKVIQEQFVAVTDITGVPAVATAGIALPLTGTVVPANATNQAISWSVQSAETTGASITGGNTLNTTAAGTVTVRAAVANGAGVAADFVRDFEITVRMIGIIGNPWVGETLGVDTGALGGSGIISFQWMKNGTVVIGSGNTYFLTTADLGSRISVTVERSGGINASSAPIGPITWPPLTGTVSISGTALVGETLTANTDGINGNGTISLQWNSNGNAIGGATGSAYIIRFADAGSAITVTVTRSENSESVTGTAANTVPQPSVSISGTPEEWQTLTVHTSNISGAVSYQWKRKGTVNIGTNSSAYTVQTADVGATITVTITRSGDSGSVTSTPTNTVVWPPLTGTVTVSGTAIVGGTLTADTNAINGKGAVSYQWYSNGNAISGASSSTYTVRTSDAGTTITVTVIRSENINSVTSNPTPAITVPETFAITFAQLEDFAPDITGPVLYKIGSTTDKNKAVSVANPGQYDSGSIQWFFGGNQITGTAVSGIYGETLTLSSATYSNIGKYFITVEVKKDGKRYSKAIGFEVKLQQK